MKVKDGVFVKGKSGIYVLEEFKSMEHYRSGAKGRIIQRGQINNLVVNEGDDYLVDQLATTPAINAMDCMALGTGWPAATKADTWLTTPFAGNGHDTVNQGGFDSGFPKIKPGGGNENILQYQSVFEPGYATQNGIDEAIISNVNPDGSGADPGSSTILAHGEITPVVNKTSLCKLTLLWELTFLGA